MARRPCQQTPGAHGSDTFVVGPECKQEVIDHEKETRLNFLICGLSVWNRGSREVTL
jgi:hypothetical protein